MIKLEIQLALRNATCAADYSACQINCAYIGLDNLHVTKNAAQRINNVAGIKIAGRDLVQHRRKENEIIATDQRHFYVRSTCEPFFEVHCRVKPGKSATGNDYSSRFHGNTANRNATRAIKILLIANAESNCKSERRATIVNFAYVGCGMRMVVESCRGADFRGLFASSV